jgi:SnoaL-like domain
MRAEIISWFVAQLLDRVGEANPKLLHWLCPFLAHALDRVMRFFSENCSLEMPRGPDPWGSRFAGMAAVREALRRHSQWSLQWDTHFVAGDIGVSPWTLRGSGTRRIVSL